MGLLLVFFSLIVKSQSKFTVVLDPGHGGKDSVTRANGYLEKDVVLNIALELKTQLEQKGNRVLLTRNEDTFVPLSERSELKGDVFISLHANSVPDSIGPSVRSMIKGIEIYTDNRMSDKKRLSKSTLLASAIYDNMLSLTDISVRFRVKNKPLAVLKSNFSPAVLVELGYLTNLEDLGYLTTTSCYKEMAAAFCKAIDAYKLQRTNWEDSKKCQW